jgi:ribulose-5-phosphate 4-epimerase/fuculose-1-phosphate aldolase
MTGKINYKKFFESDEVQKYATTICEITKECWDRNLSDSTGFSITQRIPGSDTVIVDKSGTGFRRNRITPKDLLLINTSGELLYRPTADNPRLAPVNVIIHLAGYKIPEVGGCVHFHDPWTNAFSCLKKTIHPHSLQSKLIGDIPIVDIDDRQLKSKFKSGSLKIPTGLHTREDVLYVMNKVADEVFKILNDRREEFKRHGVVISHYEHGIFAFGRNVEEAFENAYRAVRNAQTIINSQVLKNYPDERAKMNAGRGDKEIIAG